MSSPKTPFVMYVSRTLFAGLFVAGFAMLWFDPLPQSTLSLPWMMYLMLMYGAFEYIYGVFWKKKIDLSYAFPLLFAIFLLNFISVLLGAQTELPDLNRAEHFTSFIFVAYIVWIFFTKYLPQTVWEKHPYYTSILVFAVVCMVGVGNEVVELFLDIMFNTHTVGPGYDTSYDLVMNSLGAGLFLCFRLIHETLHGRA